MSKCPECGNAVERSPRAKYCSEVHRKRAESRRGNARAYARLKDRLQRGDDAMLALHVLTHMDTKTSP
jgi:hypothetical protein